MALKLMLKPGEKIVINGAVIRNGTDGRATIFVENKAAVLREKDFMREEEATSPARRLYFLCMLAYLDADGAEHHRRAFIEWLGEILAALENPAAKAHCVDASLELSRGNYYKALAACRKLIAYEDDVLAQIPPVTH